MTPDQKEAFRREVLEEAAKVADHCHLVGVMGAQVVSAAIRALAASQPVFMEKHLRAYDRAWKGDFMTPKERREVMETAALHIYNSKETECLECDYPAGQPAPADTGQAVKQYRRPGWPYWYDGTVEGEHFERRVLYTHPAPAADTGQALAWQWRILPKCNGGYYSDWVVTEKLPAVDNCLEVQPLYAHPAPLDAERVLNDLLDNAPTDTIRKYLRSQGAVPLQKRVERAALRQKEGE